MKLALSKSQAFVITLEHPGGVVKSKQEHLVALAKNQRRKGIDSDNPEPC